MTPVHIRRARPFDAGPMVRLLNTIVAGTAVLPPPNPMTAGELQDWMAHGDLWHLAERAGQVLGFQWVEPHPQLPDTTCDIATFVMPDGQGMGIGSSLFDATRKAAKSAGFTHIHAKVRAANEGGLIYYQSRGFERLTPRDDPTSVRPPVQSVTMTYRL
ncbi:GNAT family N-acetyltransferase [Jannaschia donghaensis]|uniref:Ribosomal-protein-alanine acetyltransferase n=1 Tax=Jannaschia donghaensis TaxID=420998 RepID=A0A0M6YHB8_9RHOB|nr:GNAT family N-acetyltransferase [Jannaschia donghaensis]CTQ48893.1 ribosomal-protein-alanine acetyltransferase [Jannaschia donghaensis]